MHKPFEVATGGFSAKPEVGALHSLGAQNMADVGKLFYSRRLISVGEH